MSTLEDLDDMEREGKDQKKDQDGDDKKTPGAEGPKDAEMKDADAEKKAEEDVIDLEILRSSTIDITNRRRMLENELKIMKSEFQRLKHEETTMKDKIKENSDKIENNRYAGVKLQAEHGSLIYGLQTTTVPRRKRRRAFGSGRGG
jgi:26S proteasome regulatory subunit T5